MADHDHDSRAFVRHYRKIYFTLLILLVISVAGPFLEIVWLTLITAFGIALVKANLVIQNFMQLRWEKRLVRWMLMGSLVLMALFVAGVAPDIMEHEGQGWVNVAAIETVRAGLPEEPDSTEEVGPEGVEVAGVDPTTGGFDAQRGYNTACAICHGEAGDGQGPAGVVLTPSPANFTDPVFWETRDADRIFAVIRDGAASVGGSTLMVAWSAVYDDEQIQALADYVQSFRPGGN